MKEELHIRLQEALSIRNLKQVDLCERTGISKSKISQYVRGDHAPKLETVYLLAKALEVEEAWLMGYDVPMEATNRPSGATSVNDTFRIPLLGRVAAGAPLFDEGNVIGEVLVDPALVRGETGLFALKVKGDSMSPKILDGDTLIVREQPDADNGDEGTCKKIQRYPDTLALVSLNPVYEPIVFTWEEVEQLPVRIVGKVIQSRRDY